MFTGLTLKTLSSLFASILSFSILSSSSVAPAPTPTPTVDDQQIRAIQEFHDLQFQVAKLKVSAQFGRVLKRGSQGDDVHQLQQYLSTFAPSFVASNISGYFGVVTEKAVRQFQSEHHLPVSGIFDGQTEDGLAVLVATNTITSGSDTHTSDLENFLNNPSDASEVELVTPIPAITTTPASGSTSTPTPIATTTPDPNLWVSVDALDQACLDYGYIVPPDPTPVPTPVMCITATPTPTPTPTKTPTPTPTPTPIKTPTPTPTPTKTPTPTPTPTPIKTPTPTP